MKAPDWSKRMSRGLAIAMLVVAAGSSVSCMTTYDPYGRPVQSVDPGVAVAGVLAAGMVGYALAEPPVYRPYFYGPPRYYPQYYHCR